VQGWKEGNFSMTEVPGDALGSTQAQAGLPWPRGQVASPSIPENMALAGFHRGDV